LAYGSGMIGLPLRLLAREVFDRVVERCGPRAAALVTGEEKIAPPSPRYWICTVEAMPLEREVDFLAIDEIQLAADLERGRVFTSRLLHARGRAETLFLGSETMRPILRRLFPKIRFLARERFSTLSHAGPKKLSRLPRRSAIVGFSAETVYAVAELVRRQRGGAAVILGALSPRTRNAQAALYQSGEVDYLVATDAIGMGLNMDIDHVAFAATRKFDGVMRRGLRHDELAQIAGRAGRHMRDGTFGVTADCRPFDEETVASIETHQFDPVRAVQWRAEALDFSSLPALKLSLDSPPPRAELRRARPGDDEIALALLSALNDGRNVARGDGGLVLLWDVCQIPDFRKITPEQHARLLGEIYLQIAHGERIPGDWLAPRLARLDRADGDIDAISTRIAHVRTFTYLSHRSSWIDDAPYWQEKARAIEDSLSDALHEKLTQRFVDRRTSVLLKKLRDDAPLLAGVTDDGEVIVEGQFVGRLLGFEFIVDPRAKGVEAKRVRMAADKALAPILAARAAALANAAPDELVLREDGAISWRASGVARLAKGPAPLRPDIHISGLDSLSPHLRGRIKDRLDQFLAARIEILLGDLIALNNAVNAGDAGGLNGLARGVAFRLIENFGAMSRAQFDDELKQLDQTERGKLRKLGVRFGEYTLFTPSLLKPAPARLLALLWALWTDRKLSEYQPPKAGLVSLPVDRDLPHAYYYASGYRPSGARAVRIDMLERLAGQIRSERNGSALKGGFEASPQMMSLVGCSGEEFETILNSLGYRKQTAKVQRPVVKNDAPPPAEAPVPDAPTNEANSAEIKAADADGAAGPSEPPAPQGEAAPAPASEPQSEEREITLWRLAPRRPPRPKPAPREARTAPAARPREQDRRPKSRGGKAFHKDGQRPVAERRPSAPPHSMKPQHLKVPDPNSPFAVLAGLKDEMARRDAADKPEKSN
ncbi:MAG: helicase-related protein, partial [Amphiplicatus sp.]